HRHHQPDQRGQGKACQGRNLQPERVPRTKVTDYSKGQQKHTARNRSQRNQAYVNDAVYALAAATVLTLREVAFVVSAHLRRQTGNVVSPARQDLAHNRINALLTHKELR